MTDYDDPHEGAWDHLYDPDETCQGCCHEQHQGPCQRDRCDCQEGTR